MFTSRSEDDKISAYINSVLQDEPESIRRRFISALAVLSDDDLRAVERFAQALAAGGPGDAAEQGEDQQ